MKNCMWKRIAVLVMAMTLLMGGLGIPKAAHADGAAKDWDFYLIPDSDTRVLTKEEIWKWDYESLWYLINEIFAGHGFVFKEGGQFESYFSRQAWYTPNNDTRANKQAYAATNNIEWQNEHLIKVVQEEMKALDTKNTEGTRNWKDAIPPEGMLSGFVSGKIGKSKTWPVYAAPSSNAWRGANGKACYNAGYNYWAAGWENGWLLVLYETNKGSVRIGYAQPSYDTGITSQLSFSYMDATVVQDVTLTDDPMLTNSPVGKLRAGDHVTYLTTFYGYGAEKAWAYVETTVDGLTARGFVPTYTLDLGYYDEVDETSAQGNG